MFQGADLVIPSIVNTWVGVFQGADMLIPSIVNTWVDVFHGAGLLIPSIVNTWVGMFQGADLLIPTQGQQALSAELARSKYLTLRVTDVDEEEKRELW